MTFASLSFLHFFFSPYFSPLRHLPPIFSLFHFFFFSSSFLFVSFLLFFFSLLVFQIAPPVILFCTSFARSTISPSSMLLRCSPAVPCKPLSSLLIHLAAPWSRHLTASAIYHTIVDIHGSTADVVDFFWISCRY